MRDKRGTIHLVWYYPFLDISYYTAFYAGTVSPNTLPLSTSAHGNTILDSSAGDSFPHALVAVVFGAICLENYLYRYACLHMTPTYFAEHLDNLRPDSKWELVIKLASGHSLNPQDARYQQVHELFVVRNGIVHQKSSYAENATRTRLHRTIDRHHNERDRIEQIAVRVPEIVKGGIDLLTELHDTPQVRQLAHTILGPHRPLDSSDPSEG